MRAVAKLCLAAVLLQLTLGCSRSQRDCSASESQPIVEPGLLSFLSRARAAHHLADNQERTHPEQALATLRAVLNGPKPGTPSGLTPEVREVLADTAARVADMESSLGRFNEATRTVHEALGWVPDVSYFRGHLFEVMGLIEERLARTLDQQQKPSEAQIARSRAMAAFEQSMEIQAEVIRTASADAGKH